MSNSIACHSNISHIAALFALTCVLSGLAPAASADAELVVKHVTVGFDDLNLEAESGARRLIKRLNAAALEACGGTPDGGPLNLVVAAKRRLKECRGAAVQTAVSTLDHPTVTAVSLDARSPHRRMANR